ncbi:MAG: hypothetical protein RSG50_12015 [Clostridia bacterium]
MNTTMNIRRIPADHLRPDENGRTQFAPTLSRIIKQFKGSITKQIGFSIWQKSFNDRMIRNEQGYREVWQYIDTNPLKWEKDCLFEITQTQTDTITGL